MARDFGLIAPWLTAFWAANEAAMGHDGVMAMHYPASADLLNWLFLALATPVQFYSGADFYLHAWESAQGTHCKYGHADCARLVGGISL